MGENQSNREDLVVAMREELEKAIATLDQLRGLLATALGEQPQGPRP